MAENTKGQRPYEQRNEESDRDQLNRDDLTRRVNKTTDDLDEKSSGIGRVDRDGSRGLSSKDGLTGSDLDGQVTR